MKGRSPFLHHDMKIHPSLKKLLTGGTVALTIPFMVATFLPCTYAATTYTLNGETIAWPDDNRVLPDVKEGGNKVEINEISADDSYIFGAYTRSGLDVAGNNVTVCKSDLTFVYGAYTDDGGKASANEVHLKEGTSVSSKVYGAWVKDEGTASSNTVTLDGSTMGSETEQKQAELAGALSEGSALSGNSVSLSNQSGVYGHVYGAHYLSDDDEVGDVSNNSVSISNSQVTMYNSEVIGGSAHSDYPGGTASVLQGGAVHKNSVTISDGAKVTGLNSVVIGGRAQYAHTSSNATSMASGDATENSVTILGKSLVGGSVYGGWTMLDYFATDCPAIATGKVSENTVTITDATVGGRVTGGCAELHSTINGDGTITIGEVSKNVVTLKAAIIGDSVWGGVASFNGINYDDRPITGGQICENKVYISEGSEIYGSVTGGYGDYGDVCHNIVEITHSWVEDSVDGGYGDGDISAQYNRVTITKSTVGTEDSYGSISGGDAGGDSRHNQVTVTDSTIYGGVGGGGSEYGVSDDNHVTVTSSTIYEGVTGGYSYDSAAGNHEVSITDSTVMGNVYGAWTIEGDASHNEITIKDSEIQGDICGGEAVFEGNATHNTITLQGKNCKLEGAALYGGNAAWAQSDVTTGNKLVLDGFQGTVQSAENFDTMDFTLRDWDPSTAVLDSVEAISLDGVTVTVVMESIAADAALPAEGQEILLFGNYTGTLNVDEANSKTTGVKRGISEVYDFEVDWETLSFTGEAKASVVARRLNPQTKALAEGRMAALMLGNRAANLAAEQGVAQAARAAAGKKGLAAYVALSSGHEKGESGSRVNVDGMATMVGVSAGMAKERALTLSGFVESGWGQYTTRNSFADAPAVRGTGESSYCGGGLLARYAFRAAGCKGLALDAALRAGRQSTDFSSSDLNDGLGNYASYDVDTPYIAGHVGASYSLKAADTLEAQLYTRYLWSHLGAESISTCGDHISFESVESHRLRVGTRATWAPCAKWQHYAGLACEWEFSGTARAAAQGMGMDAPSMRGGSLIGEIGTSWQPCEQTPLWLHGGIQGSVGKVQGYSANIGCTVAF